MRPRQRFKVGDLVEHTGKLHPDFGKIGIITKISATQRTMKIAIVMCDEKEKAWFVGDFKRVAGEKDES